MIKCKNMVSLVQQSSTFRVMKNYEIFYFSIGFTISLSVVFILTMPFGRNALQRKFSPSRRHSDLNEENLSIFLHSKVKVLCIVATHPANHKTKAIHVKNTWGRRCNKLLFMTSQEDPNLETVVLPVVESRNALWNITKLSFKYAYDHHIDDFDWFLKADDDNYIIVENLRHMLSQYSPKTALYFGHRYFYGARGDNEGFMAGGGYILSKKALQKFEENLVMNETICSTISSQEEDVKMAQCLAHSAIFVDTRDELKQNRFFPLGVEVHMKDAIDPLNSWYKFPQGNTDCCSNTAIGFHYVPPHELYELDCFIYKVHPFGIDRRDVLPRKLSWQEIIDASDANNKVWNFPGYKVYHNLEPSEMF